jgi:protocatechuate 3,4-dioxygenase beta subunit
MTGDALLYGNTYVSSTDTLSGCTENSDKGVDTLEYNLASLYKNIKKNLIQKGISVTDDMKLTTLVNKIMNIKLATKLTATFDNGVVTATLIDSNNNPVPNAKIELIDNSNTNSWI